MAQMITRLSRCCVLISVFCWSINWCFCTDGVVDQTALTVRGAGDDDGYVAISSHPGLWMVVWSSQNSLSGPVGTQLATHMQEVWVSAGDSQSFLFFFLPYCQSVWFSAVCSCWRWIFSLTCMPHMLLALHSKMKWAAFKQVVSTK